MNLSNDQLIIMVVTAVIATVVKEVVGWIIKTCKPLVKTAATSFIIGLKRRWAAIVVLYDLCMSLFTLVIIYLCLSSKEPATIGAAASLVSFALLHVHSVFGFRDGIKKFQK